MSTPSLHAPDLIFVSLEDWDDTWRRHQFLCAGLARRFPDTRLLFVGLPRDVSHSLRRGRLRDALRDATWSVPGFPGITVLRPLKLLPNTLAWGRRLNEAHARAQVRRASARLGLRRPLLWLNPHWAAHMAGRMGECAVVYDITDDWTRADQPEWLRRLTIAQDEMLCRRADAVIVCSRNLYDLKRGRARRICLISNGVDVDHYSSVPDPTLHAALSTRDWPRPVLGYTGTVHPERVDVALVETLAASFSNGTVVLIGPDLLTPQDRARLLAVGNVRLTGPVPYIELPDYMRAFDICITPHRMTPFTESLNPIKLWEYFASGRPIVSTDVAGFRDYPGLVRIASKPQQFVAACRDALGDGNPAASARIAEAHRHTWEMKVDEVIAVLESVVS